MSDSEILHQLSSAAYPSNDAIEEKFCLKALFLSDPTADRENLISGKGERVAGTCEWIKKHECYQAWLSEKHSGSDGDHSHPDAHSTPLLWISGGPGKGKTMMSIYLTEELERHTADRSAELVFFFCSAQDERRDSAVAVLRGLVYQILQKRPTLIKHALHYYDMAAYTWNPFSSFDIMWTIFKEIVTDDQLGHMFCILDGLDECNGETLETLVQRFTDLLLPQDSSQRLSRAGSSFKLAIVSRELSNLDNRTKIKLDLDKNEEVTKDVHQFINVKVDELCTFHAFDEHLVSPIIATLRERAEGTFLWVSLAVYELSQKQTRSEMLDVLYNVPRGLPAMYARILLRIPTSHREISKAILRWVILAVRPMSLQELAAAVHVQATEPGMTLEQSIRDTVALCGPLLEIQSCRLDMGSSSREEAVQTNCVSLVHHSARDYLQRTEPYSNVELEDFRLSTESSHLELARKCLDCITRSSLRSFSQRKPIKSHAPSSPRKFPLLEYAVQYWPTHAKGSSILATELVGSYEIFNKPLLGLFWRKYYNDFVGRPSLRDLPEDPLHQASLLGILPWVSKILGESSQQPQYPQFLEKTDLKKGETALLWAVIGGEETIIRLLIDSGADVNAKTNSRRTMLHWAALKGEERIVRLLLDNGAGVNTEDNEGMTPLHFAALRGGVIARLLVDGGADVNAKNRTGRTALHWAALSGEEIIARLLVDSGADVNAKTNTGTTALHWAALRGDEIIARLLVHSGADFNIKDNTGMTALHWAALRGEEIIARLLLDSGADVNTKTDSGMTALHCIALYGNGSAVFLPRGLRGDTLDELPRQAGGSMEGYAGIVRLLLEHGADMNAQDRKYDSVLQAASHEGYEAFVRLLLQEGADANAQDGGYGSALQEASHEGHEAVVKLLLEHGADVNTQDVEYGGALHAAVAGGQEAILSLLLEEGADINAQHRLWGSALRSAVILGQMAILRLLLDNGAKANIQDWWYSKAIQKPSGIFGEDGTKESGIPGAEALVNALKRHDYRAVGRLLQTDFRDPDQNEYEWLRELAEVGYEPSDIANFLIEEENDAPWIYFDPQNPQIQKPGEQRYSSMPQNSSEIAVLSAPWVSERHGIKATVQRLCGLGGISPISRSLHEWNGEVVFEREFSISYISYTIPSQDTEAPGLITVVPRLARVLENFCGAVTALQDVGSCLNHITIARAHVAPTALSPGRIELERIDISLAFALRTRLEEFSSSISSSGSYDMKQPVETAMDILRPLLPRDIMLSTDAYTPEESLHMCCLAAQFLCVGLVSFCQGHVGPIESILTNYSQEHSMLLGSFNMGGNTWRLDNYIDVRLCKLTCLGEMTEGPLITFSMSKDWMKRMMETHNFAVSGDEIIAIPIPSKSHPALVGQNEHNVLATPKDILYTWGPGQLIESSHDESQLLAIRVGGGTVYRKDADASEFHWEAGSGPSELPQISFHHESKIIVGALVEENTEPCSFPWQDWRTKCPLVYLGVRSERWDPNQRQLGLQVGPDHVAFQANQIWTRTPERLLKELLLEHGDLQTDDFPMIEFLGCYMGVQVSCCTGVARRIPLQELLNDLVPKFCITYRSEEEWNDWDNKHHILAGLHSTPFSKWLSRLRIDSIEVYKYLLQAMVSILKILEPTGLSRDGKYIQIAWPKEHDFSRGIKVPCENVHVWAQVLADTEDGATFAYMTTACLLCNGKLCQQQTPAWTVTPRCLGTAVTRHRNELNTESRPGTWALQNGKSYHMSNGKRYIRVRADVSGSEHRLVASRSVMPWPRAIRHFVGKHFKEMHLIREHHHPDDDSVDVLMLDKS